jgi:uncharacterized protein (TIGR00369 family)
MTATYPPAQHLLRDLRFSFEHAVDGRTSRAWMPIVDEICTDHGVARTGVLATLVDVIGGGLAAAAAHPSWIATADLTIHIPAPPGPGATVEARARVLRSGRTTVVLEVDLLDERERGVGIATMSFSVLPRRDINPDITESLEPGPTTMATETSGLTQPLAGALAVRVLDAGRGEVEVPVTEWTRNSMGAMQGGVVAMVADIAAEHALRSASRRPMVVRDMQLTYLGFGRTGPVRTRTEILGAGAARVEIIDTGSEDRRMTTVSVRGA